MNNRFRVIILWLVAGVAVIPTGCKSKNEGLLEDTKWSSAYVPDYKGMSMRGVTMTLMFHGDGRFEMGLSGPSLSATIRGKWRLGSGNSVMLHDLSMPLGGLTAHTESITVSGDTLTMADADGTKMVFTKIDPEMEKASKIAIKSTYTAASPNANKTPRDQRESSPGFYK